MSKIIKDNVGGIIKPAPIEVETKMEDFIAMIEKATEEGYYDELLADKDLIQENDTSARLLRLIEDASDTYSELYKQKSGGAFVAFDIDFKLAPLKEGEYVGKAICNFTKLENGKRKILISKVFGFRTMDEVRKNDWGEILLVQMVAELIGCSHILSNLTSQVKHKDIVEHKFRQANLKKK